MSNELLHYIVLLWLQESSTSLFLYCEPRLSLQPFGHEPNTRPTESFISPFVVRQPQWRWYKQTNHVHFSLCTSEGHVNQYVSWKLISTHKGSNLLTSSIIASQLFNELCLRCIILLQLRMYTLDLWTSERLVEQRVAWSVSPMLHQTHRITSL